jgi:hypothetical protein
MPGLPRALMVDESHGYGERDAGGLVIARPSPVRADPALTHRSLAPLRWLSRGASTSAHARLLMEREVVPCTFVSRQRREGRSPSTCAISTLTLIDEPTRNAEAKNPSAQCWLECGIGFVIYEGLKRRAKTKPGVHRNRIAQRRLLNSGMRLTHVDPFRP